MAHLVFVVGKSGDGKSTSLRNLDPESTMIINTDQKALPFKKFEDFYSKEKLNYTATSQAYKVLNALKKANQNSNMKRAIIDTWSRIMTDAIMADTFRNNKGFDKWSTMAGDQYDLINYINNDMRKDMIVYIFAHPETHYDESGFSNERIAVQGKQLEKFVPESFSSIVLYTDKIKTPGQPIQFTFRTVNSGNDTAKTPIEMFEESNIPNDLVIVEEKIREYYGI